MLLSYFNLLVVVVVSSPSVLPLVFLLRVWVEAGRGWRGGRGDGRESRRRYIVLYSIVSYI